jgi:hypothetical protein
MKMFEMNSAYRMKMSQGDFHLEMESHEREFVEGKLVKILFAEQSCVGQTKGRRELIHENRDKRS